MFSGIVQGVGKIVHKESRDGLVSFTVELPAVAQGNITIGASISLSGVCLTVTKTDQQTVVVDVIQETLTLTTLGSYEKGDHINIERSIGFGSEIGGHILSGHVITTATITSIEQEHEGDVRFVFSLDPAYMKYIMHKGYIAINGCSLTVIDPKPEGTFVVSLIPETQLKTTFGTARVKDSVNIEIDAQTQTIVDTIERYMKEHRVS